MAVMLVAAVSAAGLFLGLPALKTGHGAKEAAADDASTAKSVDERSLEANRAARSTEGVEEPPVVPRADGETGRSSAELSAANEAATDDGTSDRGGAGDDGAPESPGSALSAAPGVASRPVTELASSLAQEPRDRVDRHALSLPVRGDDAAAEIARPAAAASARSRPRENPRVAVVAVGEPMLASAAEDALEKQLARHGLDLYDERGILELRDGGVDAFAPSALVEIVAERGVDVLVLIDAEALGERELRPLNRRYDYATTTRLRVDALLAAEADGIGAGWSEQVEYTNLNAAIKADQAMGRLSGELVSAIADAWASYRDAR
jgi:hypothetical protein